MSGEAKEIRRDGNSSRAAALMGLSLAWQDCAQDALSSEEGMRRELGVQPCNLHAQSDEVGGCALEPPLPLALKSLQLQLSARTQEAKSSR